jgi:hypothetical protein
MHEGRRRFPGRSWAGGERSYASFTTALHLTLGRLWPRQEERVGQTLAQSGRGWGFPSIGKGLSPRVLANAPCSEEGEVSVRVAGVGEGHQAGVH